MSCAKPEKLKGKLVKDLKKNDVCGRGMLSVTIDQSIILFFIQ
jgi:hypothetical protein